MPTPFHNDNESARWLETISQKNFPGNPFPSNSTHYKCKILQLQAIALKKRGHPIYRTTSWYQQKTFTGIYAASSASTASGSSVPGSSIREEA